MLPTFTPMLDLFDTAPLPGLGLRNDIVSPDEQADLVALIDAAPLAPFRFQGWTGKRLTASYGWHYDFDAARFARALPIPEPLLPLRERAAAWAGLAPAALVQCLLIRYDPGAGIGWHRDRPLFEHVIGISLGAPATMRLRRRTPGGFERAKVELAPRSLYHLSGEARHGFEHSIAPMERTRWSITFRSLSAKGVAVTSSVDPAQSIRFSVDAKR